jgi:hypothetical protein
MAILGSGEHSVPAKYIGSAEGNLVSGTQIGGASTNGGIGAVVDSIPSALIQLGSEFATKVGGTRYVVNKGYDLVPYQPEIFSGQGLAFDGTQFIDVGAPLTQEQFKNDDWTLAFVDAETVASTAYKIWFGNSHLSVLGGDFSIWTGANLLAVPFESTDKLNGSYAVVHTFDATALTHTYTTYKNGVKVDALTTAENPVSPNEPFTLGGRHIQPDYLNGTLSGVCLIPQALTNAEIAAHYQRPEETIYYEGATLKSAFLNQTTLDSMKAGVGFCYLLGENNSAGAWVRNLCVTPTVLNSNPDFVDSSLATGNIGSVIRWNWSNGVWKLENPVGWTGLYLTDFTMSTSKTYIVDVLFDSIDGSLVVQPEQEGTKKVTVTNAGWNRAVFSDLGAPRRLLLIGNVGLVETSVSAYKVYEVTVSGALSLIVNYNNSAMRDNAKSLTEGLQQLAVVKDGFGVPIGLPKNGLMEFDGKSYVDLLSKEVVGDWFLDVFVDASSDATPFRRSVILKSFDGAALALPDTEIFVDPIGGRLKIRIGGVTSILEKTSAVISIEVSNGFIRAYDEGQVVKETSANVPAKVQLHTLASDSAKGLFSNHNIGSFAVELGTRTDAQRDAIVSKLKLKHGVV